MADEKLKIIKKNLWAAIALCVLAAGLAALTVINTVLIAAAKNKIAALEHEIAGFHDAALGNMGLQAGIHKTLPYRIYVPEDKGETYPLVLYLHPAGNVGSDNRIQMKEGYARKLLSEENRAKYPCVFLAPQCPEGKGWVRQPWGPGIAEDLMELLEKVCAQYPVDRSRIYVTGMSMGGFGAWGMLREYPEYFAAAVPICGGWDLEDDVENAPAMKNVPIWAFHGALDTAVPVERSRDMVKALEAVGGNIKYTEYPDEGHMIGDRAYNEPELFPWLFACRKAVQ